MGGWKLKREHFWQQKNEGSVAHGAENRKVLSVFKKTANFPTRTGMPQGVTHESCWPSHCCIGCGFGRGVAGVAGLCNASLLCVQTWGRHVTLKQTSCL